MILSLSVMYGGSYTCTHSLWPLGSLKAHSTRQERKQDISRPPVLLFLRPDIRDLRWMTTKPTTKNAKNWFPSEEIVGSDFIRTSACVEETRLSRGITCSDRMSEVTSSNCDEPRQLLHPLSRDITTDSGAWQNWLYANLTCSAADLSLPSFKGAILTNPRLLDRDLTFCAFPYLWASVFLGLTGMI